MTSICGALGGAPVSAWKLLIPRLQSRSWFFRSFFRSPVRLSQVEPVGLLATQHQVESVDRDCSPRADTAIHCHCPTMPQTSQTNSITALRLEAEIRPGSHSSSRVRPLRMGGYSFRRVRNWMSMIVRSVKGADRGDSVLQLWRPCPKVLFQISHEPFLGSRFSSAAKATLIQLRQWAAQSRHPFKSVGSRVRHKSLKMHQVERVQLFP